MIFPESQRFVFKSQFRKVIIATLVELLVRYHFIPDSSIRAHFGTK